MDRQDTENGRNQRELFYGSYRVQLKCCLSSALPTDVAVRSVSRNDGAEQRGSAAVGAAGGQTAEGAGGAARGALAVQRQATRPAAAPGDVGRQRRESIDVLL